MNKEALILYLDLMLETAKSFMILLNADEIDEMKAWCQRNNCRYTYSHHNPEKTSYYYEISHN